MVVGVLGIQKVAHNSSHFYIYISSDIPLSQAGAAFVALDPTHPTERKAFIMSDSAAKFVITMSGVMNEIPVGAQV